jgi:hypothetical protein
VAQFRYRLQRLLEEKIRAKDTAHQQLSAAQRDLRTEEEELVACRNEQSAVAETLRRALAENAGTGEATGQSFRMRRQFIERQRDQLAQATGATRAQELHVQEAGERVAAARASLALCSREVDVLEKHKSRLECRFNLEVERKVSLEQEEMATIIFLRGKQTQ